MEEEGSQKWEKTEEEHRLVISFLLISVYQRQSAADTQFLFEIRRKTEVRRRGKTEVGEEGSGEGSGEGSQKREVQHRLVISFLLISVNQRLIRIFSLKSEGRQKWEKREVQHRLVISFLLISVYQRQSAADTHFLFEIMCMWVSVQLSSDKR